MKEQIYFSASCCVDKDLRFDPKVYLRVRGRHLFNQTQMSSHKLYTHTVTHFISGSSAPLAWKQQKSSVA